MGKKFKMLLIIFPFTGFLFFSPLYAQDFKRDPRIAEIKPPKPVRIQLKRSEKGAYTWELSGNDVDGIIKADTALRNYMKNPNARPASSK